MSKKEKEKNGIVFMTISATLQIYRTRANKGHSKLLANPKEIMLKHIFLRFYLSVTITFLFWFLRLSHENTKNVI